MHLSPDDIVFWQHGFLKLNATIAYTWGLMLVLAVGSKLVTRNLSTGLARSRWQNLLEIVVTAINGQIAEVGLRQPEKYLGFLGTLFLFVAMASLFTVVPGSVPLYGIEDRGLGGYLRAYLKPTFIMLPFNIISELSRTLALAVRLFGNMMSGTMILAILLTVTPFIFPIAMSALGLLTGMVQAYIFFILATVYIAAATRTRKTTTEVIAEPKPDAEAKHKSEGKVEPEPKPEAKFED